MLVDTMARTIQQCPLELRRGMTMRLYALVEAGDPETIDLFLTEEEAERALQGCLRDEPEWCGILRVEPVEFEASISVY
jgi:hypothetical protein